LFLVMLFSVTFAFSQNYNSLYTYESINGIEEKDLIVDSSKDSVVVNLEKGAVSLIELMRDEVEKGVSIQDNYRRNSVVITKAKEKILIRFNGEFSNLQLVDFKGDEVQALYHDEYKGIILSKNQIQKNYFLKTQSNLGRTTYHRVNF